MRENTPLRAWRAGGQTIGGWLSIGNAFTAEAMARVGFDWLCIDMQHGLIGYEDLKVMLPAISTTATTPFVRVPWNDPATIMKALDAGAYGVIVPLVNNRAEAERAVAACRYPPDGMRSFGPIRAALYGGRGYVAAANDELACIVMIETREALANLDEILATPGVDAAYIGPSDLAYALDLPPVGDNDDPKHVETVARIAAKCREHGVAAGIHTSSLTFTQRYLAAGFNFVTLGTDAAFMQRLARQELAAARQASPAEVERSGY